MGSSRAYRKKPLSRCRYPKVVQTVRGRGFAEQMAEVLTERLPREEREAGFRVFLRKGRKPARLNLRKIRTLSGKGGRRKRR